MSKLKLASFSGSEAKVKQPHRCISLICSYMRTFLFSMEVYANKQGIQDSIANGQYPNYEVTNKKNEKETNIKVKLMKVWIYFRLKYTIR